MLKRILVLVVSLLALALQPMAAAAKGLSLIRDAEIENTIRVWSTPLFEAAGLDPNAVRIVLVSDRTLNAFVAGGSNIFIHTGLLLRSETPGQVIGVIAHETGHITGGHLARLDNALERAGTESLIAGLLAAVAAAATGRGDLGMAVMSGGSEIATRNFLTFTRSQESAADQAAARLLEATGQSASGMLAFLEILGDQELLVTERQDPYVRTHPLSADRISFLRRHVAESSFSEVPAPPEFVEMHRRMRAKLYAFIEPTARTLQRYKEADGSIEARYARAIGYYRRPDMGRALPLVDGLIAERPRDPYFHELKGQMLFENGRPREALGPYVEAVRLAPDEPLLRVSLAQVQLALEDPTLVDEARHHLAFALQREPDSGLGWRLLAIAHSRAGDEPMVAYAMAEHSLHLGNLDDAMRNAERAAKLLPEGSPAWLRVQDIRIQAQRSKEKQER